MILKIAFFAAIVFLIYIPLFSQAHECKQGTTGDFLTGDKNHYDTRDWKKFETKTSTIILPPSFSKIVQRCLDSDCSSFEGPMGKVTIDVSLDAGFPVAPKTTSQTFREEHFCENDSWVWLWHFEEKDRKVEFPFQSGVLFSSYSKDHLTKRAGVYFFSRTKPDDSLARKIFQSFTFKKS